LDILREIVFLENIMFRQKDNALGIKMKKFPWMFVKEINANPAAIFIKIYSGFSLERHFKKLQNKFQHNIIGFSVKQENVEKHLFRYQITIFKPRGLEIVRDKFPKITELFKLESCQKIIWQIDEFEKNINFEIR